MHTPPGPPPVRNPLQFVRYVRDITRDPIDFVGRRFAEYGDLYYAPIGKTRLYVTRHPDHIGEVLVTQAGRFGKTETGRAADRLKHFLGQGLLNSNGDLWRRQRSAINPGFSRRRIAAYAGTVVEATEAALDAWRPGETVDLSRAMMALTLRAVTRALFDHDVRDDTDEVAAAMTAFRRATGATSLLPAWLPFGPARHAADALAAVDRIVYRLIDGRLALDRDDLAARDDLLSQLALGMRDAPADAMSRTLLRDELLTLFLAGHDTTSHALTWALYLVSQHPAVEADLHAEVDALGRPAAFDDLDALPLTGQILDEAMRLYPPASVVSRQAFEDAEVGGFPIPAGSEVLVWLYHTHHDPRWYPQPEAFVPARFAPDAPPRPKHSYLPFGAGARQCIGKHFALMEAKLVLARVARRFTLRLAPGHTVARDFAVTLAPRGGMPMVVSAR
ncbi:MAG: cytochrome P450 [Myxococcales bacterium]|nr:cytochrome P450 [Myxococcales bacterium]